MKKGGIFIVFLLTVGLAMAQHQLHGPVASDKTDGKTGLIEIAAADAWDINDTLRLIPCYDTYCHWDTNEIHLYNSLCLKTLIPDTFPLVYDDCDYEHPHFGYVTSDFGFRKYRFHYGIDIKLEKGEPVAAAFEGRIRISKRSKTYGYVVVIRHPNGLETLYAHLSELKVQVNDYVQAGEIIGLGGNTGRSYGSHLHFEVRYKGEAINPNKLIDFETCQLKTDVLEITKSLFEETATTVKSSKVHYVRAGESLSVIARKYGTSVSKLCYANKLKETSILQIGQKIIVQ